MKIERIDLYHVAMPLISPWRTAYGEDSVIESLLCRLSSGSLEAWGESSPLAAPCYSPEWAGGAFHTARNWLAPALLGKDIQSGEQLQQELALFKGNPFARAALDNAWWTLESRRVGRPLHRLLGATRDAVPVGADFGVEDSVDLLLEQIGAAVARGFPRVKLKFRPGWDAPMLEAVRSQHPEHPFHIDCNSGYSLSDTSLFQSLDRFRLEMIEQPLRHDDVVDHAALQRAIETPICLDESITSVHATRCALSLGSCRYVNIKPGRVGGLTVARQIHDVCRAASIPCWVGGMLESGVGVAQCAALAMLDNFTYPADIFPTSRFYHEDLAERPIELADLAGVPSIAACEEIPDPDATRLARLTRDHAVIA